MPLSSQALLDLALPRLTALTAARACRIETLPGGASLRRYHRAHLEGGEPPSLVIMELNEAPTASEEITKGGPPAELPFVNVLRYLERGGVAVPRLHHHDVEHGLLYIEDLGDETFESQVLGASRATQRELYGQAIDDLVRMQRYAADHPGGCVAYERAFDRDLLRWELDHFREWGLDESGVRLAPEERRELDEMFDDIAGRLAAEPRVFVHRDYQSRNLMVQRRGGARLLRLIDFQDALLGTRAYDLVALLRDSYVELAPDLVDELVAHYAAAAEVDAQRFRALFDLQALQRKLKDAGRFVFIDRVKKNPGFLRSIPSSQRYVKQALARLPEYARLAEILERHVPGFGA